MYDRRRFLQASSAALAVGLAGCGSGGNGDGGSDGGSDGGDGGSGGYGGNDDSTASPTASPTDGSGASESITVGPDGALRFEPAELSVAPGTTVTWEWDSDFHSVTVESTPDGADWSGTGETTHDQGYTHEHTFDVEGTYSYYCQPHRGSGMTGSLIVESE